MTEVRRYGGRTYGKSNRDQSSSSQAFDEIFNKTKPTTMKWGNASYSKPRKDEGPEMKRPKTETEESSDPFSFEFDGDKPPKKNNNKKLYAVQPSRTVVLQPAVRLTAQSKFPKNKSKSVFDEEAAGEDLIMKKGNVRTYTKRAGRKIKEEQEVTQLKMDSFLSPERDSTKSVFDMHSIDSSEGTPSTSMEPFESQDTMEEFDDDLYIEKDDGLSADVKDDSFLMMQDEREDIFKRPKREPQTMYTTDGGEVTVKFRSQYLNPEVYSKFTENISPKDPVGRLSNSKVVHKNVLKHETGTTLIVVCSPKGGDEIRQTNTQSKYFKDNLKDLVKSKKKSAEELASVKVKVKSQTPESDPYDMDEDPDMVATKLDNLQQSREGSKADYNLASVIETAEAENSQTDTSSQSSLRRSNKNPNNPDQSPKNVNVDTIVKNAVAPRKYHRIFRSRNKNYMEPTTEEDSVELAAQSTESSEAPLSEAPLQSPQTDTELIEPKCDESIEASVATSEDTKEEAAEQTADSEESTQATQQTNETEVVSSQSQESVLSEDTVMEVDSSQQSNTSESQEVDTDNNSSQIAKQVKPAPSFSVLNVVEGEVSNPLPKKTKSLKKPPAERKIFRARGATPKKMFSSPKKAPAVYNVRSWQDADEETHFNAPTADDIALSFKMPPPPALTSQNGRKEGSPADMDAPPKLQPVIKKQKEPKDVPAEMPRLMRAIHWQGSYGSEAYTSLHVKKEHKELYTVVKNVKEAHECQEFGETQEFDDDIEYLLAGIKDIEPMSTRCLSCVGLAQKCILPAFRMHLRAHGTVTKIFGCLQDAASDPSLALCTSALMFMLSRDRLNMDLDRETLNLMLRLLGVDQQEDLATTLSPTATRALKRNRDRVQEVYNEFLHQTSGKQENIDSDVISTGNLAMESLLSLTSRRAGEWFKEELRSLGALDHIVDTVCSCIEAIGDNVTVLTNSSIENLKKTDRCLRVLENVTYLNADNQNYLVAYKKSCLVSSLSRGLKTCQTCLSVYPVTESSSTGKVDKESFGWVVYSCTLAILRVLLNLTHDNDTGCSSIGEQEIVIETVLLCILQLPQYVPIDLRFDLFVLSLGLLINLVEHSDLNRNKLLHMKTVPMYENPVQSQVMLAYLSLVEVFVHREESARQLEEADEPKTPEGSPNKSGEWRESDSGMEWVIDSGKKDKTICRKGPNKNGADDNDLDNEETFTKALHKAGKHMENSIVAAYIALLVGCLIQEDQECAGTVKEHLPEKTFAGMIYMLKKFLGFMNLTSGSGSAGGKSIERVIEVLEKC